MSEAKRNEGAACWTGGDQGAHQVQPVGLVPPHLPGPSPGWGVSVPQADGTPFPRLLAHLALRGPGQRASCRTVCTQPFGTETPLSGGHPTGTQPPDSWAQGCVPLSQVPVRVPGAPAWLRRRPPNLTQTNNLLLMDKISLRILMRLGLQRQTAHLKIK